MTGQRKVVIAVGKRKTAIARAYIKEGGQGRITINKIPWFLWGTELARSKIYPLLLLCKDHIRKVDIEVSVKGGGVMGQATAVASAIARGLRAYTRSKTLEQLIKTYDRYLLAGDPRRKEPKKYGGPGARRRDQTSYR
ncbi:30S ribosomal protein S9 [archaeon]|nr:30S ribosomal protein S9 [archaeon]